MDAQVSANAQEQLHEESSTHISGATVSCQSDKQSLQLMMLQMLQEAADAECIIDCDNCNLQDKYPRCFFCPLTMEVIQEPVTAAGDGETCKPFSPQTR